MGELNAVNPKIVSVTSGQTHKCVNILGIICLSICFILTAIFNALAGSGNSTFFNSVTGNISDIYELDTTPAGWTFSIWGIIYFGIAATLVFYVITIFMRNSNGYIYLSPVVASPAYCTVYGINFLMNLGWIFLWDRQLLVVSSYVLFDIAITNFIAITLLIRNIESKNHLLKLDQPKIYWTYIVLAFNGHAIYGTWTVIASLLNFTHCLVYREESVGMQTAVNVNLSMLLIIAVGWAATEMIFLDRLTRFLVTPYLVAIWALAGILSKKYSDTEVSEETKNFLLGLMAIAVTLLLIKICVLIFRQMKRPFTRN